MRDLQRNADGSWTLVVADLANAGAQRSVKAKFVFIGASGGALKLLQQSGIAEAEGYAGFPVGGQFLFSKNPEIAARHQAKVYGKASVGAPPMSVPHLDTRVIAGQLTKRIRAWSSERLHLSFVRSRPQRLKFRGNPRSTQWRAKPRAFAEGWRRRAHPPRLGISRGAPGLSRPGGRSPPSVAAAESPFR